MLSLAAAHGFARENLEVICAELYNACQPESVLQIHQ